MRGQDVDMVLVGLDRGILLADSGKALVPIGHGVDDAVGFGRRGDVLFPRHGELEGVTHDAVAAHLGEDALLHRHFHLAARIEAAADLGIFALVVLAHDVEIDLAGLAILERRIDTGEQANGPQIDVLPASSGRSSAMPSSGIMLPVLA